MLAFFMALIARADEKSPPSSTEQTLWLIPDLIPHPLALFALAGRIRPIWEMRSELRAEFICLCCGLVLFALGVWLV
jgi:hypothetical protein